jgi:hypothetical protein
MLSTILNAGSAGMGLLKAALPLGLKAIKYFVDSVFRDKVTPVPGSVLYCDLWVAVEHSGIYVGDNNISNIVVDGLAESSVLLSKPRSFTSKSVLGRKIYVSCDHHGAVGHLAVAQGASGHVGERAFYGVVIKNCHQFSTRCVDYAGADVADSGFLSTMSSAFPGETWELTIGQLKEAARRKLGATQWRLWDWDNDIRDNPPPEPDWQSHADHFANQPLNPQSIAAIRTEQAATEAYLAEITDEAIPDAIRQRLFAFRDLLADISRKYTEVEDFLKHCPGADFSYAELQACGEDFAALAAQLQNNQQIRELARKMGRNYISEERKKQTRIPQASKNEVHGTHRSDDLMRLLPSELLNLEDETLENLFYARLLEKNLQTYELRGVTFIDGEESETRKKRTGPVVACLDTSGSMTGTPLLKAKALLLAIANILKQEDRSLHILLFGTTNQILEFSMDTQSNYMGLIKFLQQGFGGGEDVDFALQRGLQVITEQENYNKADLLLISDGIWKLSPQSIQKLKIEKNRLDCSIYTILCSGPRGIDTFSDEIVVL